MLIQPYQSDELEFAWCYRVYLRCKTYRARVQPVLAGLTCEALQSCLAPYDVHILEASADSTSVLALASLLPAETVAAFAGKLKGRISKWLRERLALDQPENLLSKGYFASTAGQSSAETVEQYLEKQGEHHRYLSRRHPPVFVKTFPITPADEQRLSAVHAVTILQLHVVLSTWRRKGVFAQSSAEATTQCWRELQEQTRFVLQKVSFVPDHVHLAVRLHPSVSPAELVVALMNASQEMMWSDFDDVVIRAGVERLWQPSAYIGSYGELESKKIGAYVRRWHREL